MTGERMRNKILTLVFLWMTSLMSAQVQFEAKASKTKLGVNERLRVDFTMNKDGDNFDPPEFEDFTVVGGPNQAISDSWINGERSFSKTYSFFLAPKSRGRFTIGQAEITIEGKVYKTSPLEIEVTAAVEKPGEEASSDYIASENLHLVAEISNTNPYLNEAITVVYKLYVSPRINVSDWRQVDSPTFRDFWSQNIDIRRLEVKNGTYRGEPYRYVELRKTVLYPQKTGKLEIEPLTLSISVEVPSNKRDIFGNRFYETVEKVVAAGNRTIDVKPLPVEGKPPGFTGAVGEDLDLEFSVDKLNLKATESFQATLSVEGEGNLKLFDLPPLKVPSSIERYEPEYVENVRTDLGGMEGSIKNVYTLVPQAEGKYLLPPVHFSYFDPNSETYKTLTSEEIEIQVTPAPASSIAATPGPGIGESAASPDQFRYIKLKTDLEPVNKEPFLGSLLFWGLFLGPLALIPLAIFFGKKRAAMEGDIQGKRIRKADKLARKYLSEARKNLGDQKAFYEALERALHNYLKAKLQIQTSEMSKEHIRGLLSDRGVKPATVEGFIKLIENCEFARYTPASNVAMRQDYENSVRVISEIDKQV